MRCRPAPSSSGSSPIDDAERSDEEESDNRPAIDDAERSDEEESDDRPAIDDAERSDEEESDDRLGISERIAAAQAYIDALVTHDGDSVPFAADCTRVEQGIKNGFSGNHLRRSLSRGPQYRIIGATTTPSYTVDGDEVRAEYTVLTKFSVAGRRAAARVEETFVIPEDGLIHHIRVRFHPTLTKE